MLLPILVTLFLSILRIQAKPLLKPLLEPILEPLLDPLLQKQDCPILTVTAPPVTITLPGLTIDTTVTNEVPITTGTTTIFLPVTSGGVAKRSLPSAPPRRDSISSGPWASSTAKPSKPASETKSHAKSPSDGKPTPTCDKGITITVPAVDITTTAADVTVTATEDVTVPVQATATLTGDTFLLQVGAPGTQYDGDLLFPIANGDSQGNAIMLLSETSTTTFSVDTQGRLVLNDPTSVYNGYIGFALTGSTPGYRTVGFHPTPDLDFLLSCNFVLNQLMCTAPNGDTVFKACNNFLRIGPVTDTNCPAVILITTNPDE